MPAGFNKCIKGGGKVRTISVNDTQYMHVCYLGDKSYSGEVRTKQSNNKKGKNMKVQISPEIISKAIKESLDGIAAEAVKSLGKKTETPEKQDSDKEKGTAPVININVDVEKLAKSIGDAVKGAVTEEEDEPDEAVVFQKSVADAKSKAELKKIRDQYKLDVKVRGEIADVKKALNEAYFVEEEDDDDEDVTKKSKKKNDETDISPLKAAISKTIKEMGLNPKDVSMEVTVKGKKKSLVLNDKDEDDGKFEDDGEEVTLTDSEVSKNFDEMSKEEQDNEVREYFKKTLTAKG